jgi:hypothetical protein
LGATFYFTLLKRKEDISKWKQKRFFTLKIVR